MAHFYDNSNIEKWMDESNNIDRVRRQREGLSEVDEHFYNNSNIERCIDESYNNRVQRQRERLSEVQASSPPLPSPSPSPSRTSLDKIKYEKLELTKISADDDDDELRGTNCSICFEDLSMPTAGHDDGQCLFRFPCKHVYHRNCIRPWIHQHHYCPLCRHNLLH